MKLLKSFGICIKCAYGAFVWTFASILFAALLLQSYIAVSLARDGHVKIPDPVVDWLVARLDSEYWVEHSGVFLNFGGVITVEKPQVGTSGMAAPFLEAKRLIVDIDVIMLVVGSVRLDRLAITEARLLLPAIYSPTGVSEEIAELRKFDTRANDGVFSVDSSLFSFGTASGWIHGQFSLPRFRQGSEDPGTEVDTIDLEERLLGLYEAKEQIALAEDPIVVVQVEDKGLGANQIRAWLTGHFRSRPEIDLEIQSIEGAIIADLLWGRLDRLEMSTRLREVSWKDEFSARLVEADKVLEAPFVLNDLVHELSITAMEVNGPGINSPVDLVHVAPKIRDLGSIPLEISALWDGGHILAEIELAPIRQKARVSLETRNIGTRQLNTVDAVEKSGLSALVLGMDESRFEIDTAFGFDGEWQRIDVFGDTGPIAYKEVWLDNAWGEIEVYPGELAVKDFAIVGPNGDAEGRLEFSWPSMDLSISLSARMLPTAINPWLKPWWQNLWRPFTFVENERPDADFAIDTTVGKPRSTRFFGQVSVGRAAYREAWFDAAEARVWGVPRFTEAFDLKAQRPEGESTARLTWTFFPDRAGLYLTEYALRGVVDLRNGEKIFPGLVQNITRNFEPEEALSLEVSGITYGRSTRDKEKIRAEGGSLWARSDRPIGSYGIRLDTLELTGDFNTEQVELKTVNFRAGGGSGEGSLKVTFPKAENKQPDSSLALDFKIESFRRDQIFEVFPMLQSDNAPALEDDEGDTRINLTFNALGNPRDLYSFSGDGRAKITGSSLNDIHLFGGLSETLSNSAFPVGSLSLTELGTPVNIRGGLLEFKNIKGSGRGVTVRGEGTYQMEHDHLNFKLNLRPGNMSETPVYSLFTAILRPVASAFPIRIWGPIAEPNWALDLFTSREVFEEISRGEAEEIPIAPEKEEELRPPLNLPIGDPTPMDDLGSGLNISPISE